MKSILLQRGNDNIILNQKEVEHIVNEWYVNGMMPDILQNDDGEDLEEILNIDYSVKILTGKINNKL